MNRLIKITVFFISALLGFLLFSGCDGTGFEKKTTLVPDRVGISYSEERYRGVNAAWKGFTINAEWDLK